MRPFAKSFVDEMCAAIDGIDTRRTESGVDLPKGPKALVFDVPSAPREEASGASRDTLREDETILEDLPDEPTGDSVEIQLDFDADDPLSALAQSVDELAARARR